MARIDMDGFEEGTEIVRVYVAATLAEAQAIEDALEAADFRFAIEVEAIASPAVLGSSPPRRVAGFWVTAGDLDACADALARGGHLRGLVDRG